MKCSMHRWYLEGPASLYMFVSKRLSGNFLPASSSERVKRKQSKATHFLSTLGQGPSVAQLGLLRALRREGNPLVPQGQTTPRCCPTGHKMSGKGRAQMEGSVCVDAFNDVMLGYVKCKCKVRECFNKGKDFRLTCLRLFYM